MTDAEKLKEAVRVLSKIRAYLMADETLPDDEAQKIIDEIDVTIEASGITE
jgi:hypothetical protein